MNFANKRRYITAEGWCTRVVIIPCVHWSGWWSIISPYASQLIIEYDLANRPIDTCTFVTQNILRYNAYDVNKHHVLLSGVPLQYIISGIIIVIHALLAIMINRKSNSKLSRTADWKCPHTQTPYILDIVLVIALWLSTKYCVSAIALWPTYMSKTYSLQGDNQFTTILNMSRVKWLYIYILSLQRADENNNQTKYPSKISHTVKTLNDMESCIA